MEAIASLSTQGEDAPSASVVRSSVSGVFLNACSGEWVAWSGEAVFVDRFVFAPGGFHRVDVLQITATGTGLSSGDAYRLAQSGGLNANASMTFGTNPATFIVPVTVVNTTSGGVFHATLHFHVTRNALGELTALFGRFEFDCRG